MRWLSLFLFTAVFVLGCQVTLLYLVLFLGRGQAQVAADSAALAATQGLKEALVTLALPAAASLQDRAAERVAEGFEAWLADEEAAGRSPSRRQQERKREALWQAELPRSAQRLAGPLARGEPLTEAEQLAAFVDGRHLGCLALEVAAEPAVRLRAVEVAERNLASLVELSPPTRGRSYFEGEASRPVRLPALRLETEVKGYARASLRSLAGVPIDYDNPRCP